MKEKNKGVLHVQLLHKLMAEKTSKRKENVNADPNEHILTNGRQAEIVLAI